MIKLTCTEWYKIIYIFMIILGKPKLLRNPTQMPLVYALHTWSKCATCHI